MPDLIMFDIDGTLTATNDVDARCYVQAMFEHLGVTINSDWSRYRHVTDSGIAAQLFEEHGRPAAELATVRARFVSLVDDALRGAPGCCIEIPGAVDFLRRLSGMPEVMIVGLATGGWGPSAWAKLRHVGIEVEGIAFASADDGEARVDIMKACRDRVAMRGVPIARTLYVGDGEWDARSSRALGWPFVGIAEGSKAEKLRRAGARNVFPDFRDPHAVMMALCGSQR